MYIIKYLDISKWLILIFKTSINNRFEIYIVVYTKQKKTSKNRINVYLSVNSLIQLIFM